MASKFYARPSGFTRWMNSVMGALVARGIGPKKMAQLEIKGRKSGVVRSVAVNLLNYDGRRYLVAPRGETEWVRNARAAVGEAVLRRGKPKNVTVTEIPVGERAPIIQAYLRENAWATQREFGVSPKAPINEFEAIADKHPVFKITPRA
ncbi:MAG TPA: nitroreductase family deazaflavin-dependent oxidoreductase [Dehalococcoidia bacterium]